MKASLLLSTILGSIGNAFAAKAARHTPSRHKSNGRICRSLSVAGTNCPARLSGAKLAKKVAKGTVGLRHGAPFGQR